MCATSVAMPSMPALAMGTNTLSTNKLAYRLIGGDELEKGEIQGLG